MGESEHEGHETNDAVEQFFGSTIVKVALIPLAGIALMAWVNYTLGANVAPLREVLAHITTTMDRMALDVHAVGEKTDSNVTQISSIRVDLATLQQQVIAIKEKMVK